MVPSAPVSMRKAGAKPEGSESVRDAWLDEHNHYLASLRDPLHNPGARIPDSNAQLSTTMQFVYHMTGNNGPDSDCFGVFLGITDQNGSGPFMIPQNDMGTIYTDIDEVTHGVLGGLIYTTGPTSMGDGSTTLLSSTLAGQSTAYAAPGLSEFLHTYANQARVVSATISLRSAGNYSQLQGEFCANSLPCNWIRNWVLQNNPSETLSSITVPVLQNTAGCILKTVTEGDHGVQAFYSPTDNSNLEYIGTQLQTADVSSWTDPQQNQLNPGALFCLATNQGPNTGFLIDICINYELIVNMSQVNIGMRPSYQDPLALAIAWNQRQDDAKASPHSDFDESGINYTDVGDVSSVSAVHVPVEVTKGQAFLTVHTKPITYANSLSARSRSRGGSYNSYLREKKSVRPKGGRGKYRRKEETSMFESLVTDVLKIGSKILPALLL